MTCKNCGNPLNENDVFCGQCGSKVEPIVEEQLDLEEKVVLDSQSAVTDCEETPSCEEDVELKTTESCAIEATESLSSESEELSNTEASEDAKVENEVDFEEASNESADESVAEPEAEPVAESKEEVDEKSETSKEIPELTVTKGKKLLKIHKRGIKTHLGALALSILLSILMVTTLALFVVRNAITENSVKEIISSLELEDISIYSRSDKSDLEELGIRCDSDNVFDIIYDNIDQNALKEPLTKEQFSRIMNSNTVSEYFGRLISRKLGSAVDGKSVLLISTDDIIDFIEDEEKFVSGILGYELTEEHKNNLRITLDMNFGEAFKTLEIKDLEHIVGKVPAVMIGVVFSDWLFIGLIIICVLLIVLIFLVLRSFRLGFLYNGITILVVNLLYLVTSLSLMFGILSLWMSRVNSSLITQVVSVVLWDLVIITFSAVFVSVIMIVVSGIIKKYLIKNKS